MAKPKNTNISNSPKWHDDLFGKIIAVVTIFGFGIATGLFINSNDHKWELMQLKQDYQEKLTQEVNKSRDCKIEDQEKKIIEIYNAVQILNKKNGETK